MNRFIAPLIATTSLCTPLLSLAQDLPPVDPQAIIKALEQVESKRMEVVKGRSQRVIQDFRAAAASNSKAIAFYEEAIRATRFMGQNQQQTQFQEWKKKEAARLQSPEMQTAARLCLIYSTITLEYASDVPLEKLLPAVLNYVKEVQNFRAGLKPEQLSAFERQELLNNSVASSLFARWYGVENVMSGLKNWEMSPGKVDEIYMKTILPEWRKMKNAQAVQYWEARIAQEEKLANEDNVTFKIEQFSQLRKPTLLWSRAQEMLAIGLRNRAINEMFAVVKNFPAHPETPTRVAKIKELLTPPPAPSPEAPASTPE